MPDRTGAPARGPTAELRPHAENNDTRTDADRVTPHVNLRGHLRFGQPEFGETGTGVTLAIRDPRPRQNRCQKALPWLPVSPGAEVRWCDLVHVPGAHSLSVLAATRDDAALADQSLSQALLSADWTSEPPVLGVLVFRKHSGARETARVIWGS